MKTTKSKPVIRPKVTQLKTGFIQKEVKNSSKFNKTKNEKLQKQDH